MKVAATNARIDPNTTICSKSIAGALAAEKPNDLPHKKALTFSEDLNSTFDIPRLDEYTQNEKSELWYNTETIDDFRKKHRKEGRKTRKRFGAFVNAIEDLYLVVESISSDLNDETDFFEELKQLNADLNVRTYRGPIKTLSNPIKTHIHTSLTRETIDGVRKVRILEDMTRLHLQLLKRIIALNSSR